MNYIGLAGREVLVTGGTRGIGYAIAQAFLEQEAEVHVTGTKKDGKGPNGSVFHFCDFSVADGRQRPERDVTLAMRWHFQHSAKHIQSECTEMC